VSDVGADIAAPQPPQKASSSSLANPQVPQATGKAVPQVLQNRRPFRLIFAQLRHSIKRLAFQLVRSGHRPARNA
jgi:hypothetical protein